MTLPASDESRRGTHDQPSSAPADARLAIIERRWRGMQKVINHDLPNQLVAIHGLLQLLSQDESARLSADGQELLRRVQGTSARVLETTHMLKLLGNAGESPEKPAAVALAELAEEAAIEVKQALPGLSLATCFPPGLERINAGPRSLRHAVVLLLKLAASGYDKARLIIGAGRIETGHEIWIGLHDPGALIWSARALEDRLEVLLVRELLHAWGGELTISDAAHGERLFTIHAPGSEIAD